MIRLYQKEMCAFSNVDEEFDRILRVVDEETYLLDPGEAASSAVRPSITERQVLATVAVEKVSYGTLQTG